MEADFPPLIRALVDGMPTLLNGQEVTIDGEAVELAGIEAGGSTGDDLDAQAVAGFIRFSMVNDPDNFITRFATVDVELFVTSYARGEAVAERIRGILLNERRIGGVILDRRITVSGPREVPWDDNENLRRFLSTHRISTRR